MNNEAPMDALKKDFKKFKDKSFDVKQLRSPVECYEACHTIDFDDEQDIFRGPMDVYEIKADLGFFFIRNPFTPQFMTKFLKEAITVWPDVHGKTNLEIEADKPENIWNTSLDGKKNGRSMKDNWLYKLRWTSLGYHYHWTDQEYVSTDKSPVPNLLSSVSKILAEKFRCPDYVPQAGIVNYYHLNSTMGFHVDHAEVAKDRPLISISIGQPAIYLLGGLTREECSVPVLLQHGDVVVMTGKSRLAYHSVPRIIHTPMRNIRPLLQPGTQCCWCGKEVMADEACKEFMCELLWQYLNVTRININVRQVFPAESTST